MRGSRSGRDEVVSLGDCWNGEGRRHAPTLAKQSPLSVPFVQFTGRQHRVDNRFSQ